jgi:glycogen debranching enzyme
MLLVIGFHLLEKIIFAKKEQIMEQKTSNRVLNRMGARELSPEEVQHVAGGTTGCHGTSLHKNGPIVDVACDPA